MDDACRVQRADRLLGTDLAPSLAPEPKIVAVWPNDMSGQFDSGLARRRSCDRSQWRRADLNEERGMTVSRRRDGAEQSSSLPYPSDVALIDLRMPKLEGVQVVEQIRHRFSDAAIVILTTYDTDNDIEHALRPGQGVSRQGRVPQTRGCVVPCMRAHVGVARVVPSSSRT